MGYPDIGYCRLSNPSPQFNARAWVLMGTQQNATPTHLDAVDSAGIRHPAFAVHRSLIVRAPLAPVETRDFRLEPRSTALEAFSLPVEATHLERLIPKVFVEMADGRVHQSMPLAVVETKVDWDPVMRRSHVVARWSQVPGLVLAGDFDFFSQQRVVEWTFTPSYGTTQPGLPFVAPVKRIWLDFGFPAVVDNRRSKGLRPVMQIGTSGTWRAEIVGPSTVWDHGDGARVQGALLCASSAEHVTECEYRREAKPWGLCGGWEGRFGPFGIVPKVSSARHDSFKQRRWEGLHRQGTEDEPRETVHWPHSGQTGPGAEFGAVWGFAAHCLGVGDPSMLHFLQRDLDATFRRPLHRVEHATSRPVAAADHPLCRTYSGIPDSRLGSDMLGLPTPMQGFHGYGEPDEQHQTILAAAAMYKLTRCPALGRSLNDYLQQALMSWWRGRQPKLGEGATDNESFVPRQFGRPLLNYCWIYDDFPQAEELIRECVAYMYRAAAWRVDDESVLQGGGVLGRRLHKYGWIEPWSTPSNIVPIYSWWPWMETLGIIGLRAADRLLSIPEARELVLRSCRSIVRQGFYQFNGQWYVAYALRSRADGSPLPASSYTDSSTLDVLVGDGSTWEVTIPAVKILLELEPAGPDAPRCRELLARYGTPQTEQAVAYFAVK